MTLQLEKNPPKTKQKNPFVINVPGLQQLQLIKTSFLAQLALEIKLKIYPG